MIPPLGHEFEFEGDHFTVSYASSKIIRYTSIHGGRMLSAPLSTFETMMSSDEFEHINKDWVNYSSRYSKKDIEERNELFRLIKFVESRTNTCRSKKKVTPLLDEYARTHNITVLSPSSFAKKYKKYVESGYNINSLIPRHKDKGNRTKYFSPEQEQIVDELLEKKYLKPNSLTLIAIHKDLRIELMDTEEFKASPLTCRRMSYSTLMRRKNKLDIAERMIAKHGKVGASKMLRASGIKLETGFPLQYVEADGYVVNCHGVDEATGKVLGRPNLTVFIDRSTRSILSYTLSYKGFSVETLLPTFREALRQDNGLPGGRMSNVIVDNGSDYKSDSFHNATSKVGADLKPCKIKEPNSKPFIESVFRTLNLRCFHTLDGTTFSNPKQRGDYQSEKMAIYTLNELDVLFRMAIDEYHQNVHSQLNKAPLLAWQDWLEEKNGFIFDVPSDEINSLLGTTKIVSINKGTVRLFGLSYKSHDLAAIQHELASLGRSNKVHVYINHDDLTDVYVENPLDPSQPLIKAFSTDPDRTNGLTMNELDEQRKARSAQKKLQEKRLEAMGTDAMIRDNNEHRERLKDTAQLRKQRHIESVKQRQKPKPKLKSAEAPFQAPSTEPERTVTNNDDFGDMSWGDANG